MTSFQGFPIRNRDQQDFVERHVYGKIQYIDNAGAVIKVRGTDTEDQEAPILNMGYGMQYPENTNAEVFLVAHGSDTDQKYAIMTIPRDKQRKWAENAGGIQHPSNGDRAVEINNNETWLKDGTFILGHEKGVKVTVSGGNVTIECTKLTIKADVDIEGKFHVTGSSFKHNAKNVGDDHTHGGVEPGGSSTSVPD